MADSQSIATMKTCQNCGQEKPVEAFSRRSIWPDGRQKSCKACMSEYGKTPKARAKDHERYRRIMRDEKKRRARYETNRLWRAAHPDKVAAAARKQSARPETKASKAAWMARKRRQNPAKYALINKRCRERNAVQMKARRLLRKAYELEYNRSYRKANREAIKLKGREYYNRNREKERARGRAYHASHPNVAYRNTLTRRARLAGVFVEHVDPAILFSRDKGRCGICFRRVKRADASVDHLIPVSKGGAHSYQNTQLAHRSCNSKKHVKVIGQLRLCG